MKQRGKGRCSIPEWMGEGWKVGGVDSEVKGGWSCGKI